MKNFHHALRAQGIQRSLDGQLSQPGCLVDPPKPSVSHYPAHQVTAGKTPSSSMDTAITPHFHVLAEGDR
jgi:hypothetical protein